MGSHLQCQRVDTETRWQMRDDLAVVYADTQGEVVVGGVFLRLFISNSGWVLRRPKEFFAELLEKWNRITSVPSPDVGYCWYSFDLWWHCVDAMELLICFAYFMFFFLAVVLWFGLCFSVVVSDSMTFDDLCDIIASTMVFCCQSLELQCFGLFIQLSLLLSFLFYWNIFLLDFI